MATSDDDFDGWRPTVIEVMAEYCGTFLWDRSPEPGPCGAEFGSVGLGPEILDISSDLAGRLEAWNEEWEDWAAAAADDDDDEQESNEDVQERLQHWSQRGRELARELQGELADVRVLYHHDEINQDQPDHEDAGQDDAES